MDNSSYTELKSEKINRLVFSENAEMFPWLNYFDEIKVSSEIDQLKWSVRVKSEGRKTNNDNN